jgi:RNA polymerase sigma factor (sigma-70 family)
VSGWPSLDSSDDLRLAEALAAGDGEALPHIFDGHAARLYDYCHALLRDQETASAALYSAFVAACAHVGRLRSPERFRAWLYTLMRNECLRRLEVPAEPGMVHDPWTGELRPRREAPEVEDLFVDGEERHRRQEMRQVVHTALSSLTGRQREVLDLQLRHALSPVEIAGILGLAEREAVNLGVAAQVDLEDALIGVLIARTGRDDCPSMAALAGEWPLAPETTRRVVRHIESCPSCTGRRNRRVSAGRVLQALPVALMPADLRGRVLSGAPVPDPVLAERAEPFDEEGWPLPVQQAGGPGEPGERSAPPRLWPALAAAIVVLLVVGAAFWALPDSSGAPSSAGSPTAAPTEPATEPTEAEESPSESPSEPSDSPSEPSPSVPTSPGTTPSASPPEQTPEERPAPSARPTRAPAPVRGGLTASGCSIGAAERSCSVTLTAVDGPVRWSVAGTSGGVGAGGGGTLDEGYSVAVTASRPADCTGEGGSGSVSFTPSASAAVSWTCPAAEAPTAPED